jgi:Phosphotransferase enzyme family
VRLADGTTAVRKVLLPPGAAPSRPAHWAASDRPDHWNWWRREFVAYECRAVEAWAEPALGMPALLDVIARQDGGVELWLEDVAGKPGPEWEPADHAACAQALGRAQARTAGGGPWQSWDWLSRGFLPDYPEAQPVDETVWTDDGAWAHELVAPNLGPLREDLLRLHVERHRWYALLHRLPRTLCHLDVWPANLIARPDGRTVLLDWSFVGVGALGEDPGNLIPDSVFDLFLPGDRIGELDRAVTDSYLAGLAEAGWDGDPRLVRLAMCASMVKYHWLAPYMVRGAGGPLRHYGGAPMEEAVERYHQRGLAMAHLCGMVDEARALERELGPRSSPKQDLHCNA